MSPSTQPATASTAAASSGSATGTYAGGSGSKPSSVSLGMYLSGAVQVTFIANQFVENVRFGLELRESILRRNTVTGVHYSGSATGVVSCQVFDANVVGLVAQDAAATQATGNHFSHSQRFAVRRSCAAVIANNTYEANGVDVSGC